MPQKGLVIQTRPTRTFLDFHPGASDRDVLSTGVAKLIGREFGMVTWTEQAIGMACFVEGSHADLRAVMGRETNTADVDSDPHL